MNEKFFQEDLNNICDSDSFSWQDLKEKTIFVTGGTGLIGMTLINAIDHSNKHYGLNCKVIALVRDVAKAKSLLPDSVEFITGSVENVTEIPQDIDYIVHAACPTASAFMVSNPVEVINASVLGTVNLINLAKEKGAAFLYLSSMEVYGKVDTEDKLDENKLGYINPLVIRSCYPESKRMCEAIVAAYAHEYGVRACSLRLAQTFGPGISIDDKRVFAMMARCAMNGENIVLLTKGESRHPYLYTADAVTAILTVLLKGKSGQSYNAANPDTYCSIYEMGEMVASEIADGKIKVEVADNGDTSKYPDTSFLNLDVKAIEDLGWSATVDLKEMYVRMMESMK
ncbi:Nucleoside-diphosphate-sugar epimerase [Ruminococcus flavefaciens]|uniref:Nucleoside-diphosphate-sugar epimerase n=1 Tax=Ruminococcus flavefaciens TaxID=1265 RepID=A0A1H6KI18_RUMFL|nr:NAD-dependent epimerase/dehydratase family protein [Ruminococcus flavefaciens]SEH75009.1 Nucleoside-diphosphate-sugar epimerase [Ruminococcus flavefaciens]